MQKRYPVTLTDTERDLLKHLIAAGTESARKLTHARILLKADQGPAGPGWTDEAIAEAVEVSQPTVARIREQYVTEGLEAALNRRAPTREYVRKLDGAQTDLLLSPCDFVQFDIYQNNAANASFEALTAATTRPVQRCGEIDSCFGIGGLQSSPSTADQRDQEKDQEQEEQNLGDQRSSRG